MLKKTDNPWLGLASYEYKDAYRFFGREKELVDLKTAICNNPFTTIYGISGAGKTSLINAGMMPLLEKENYLPVRIRLEHQSKVGYNTQIIMAINNAIDNAGGEVEFLDEFGVENATEEEKLWAFLFASKIWSGTNHQLIPVVFIDQFEEIFTKNETEETITRFFDSISSLQYSTPPEHISMLLEQRNQYVGFNDAAQFRMVFIMREDFLARLEDRSFDIPALRKNRRGIKRMDGHQALEVILRPCPGIISKEVALQILGKVTGREVRDTETALNKLSVDTSILSLFCSELYQKAVEANADVITEELVGQFGDDIIMSFYEESMRLVSNKTMDYLEAHLLTYSGFRNTVALEDLTQNGIKPEELRRLAEKRLIRIETLDGTERVEFMHDVLCKVAKEHRDRRRDEQQFKKEERENSRIDHLFTISMLLSIIPSLLCFCIAYFQGRYSMIFAVLKHLRYVALLLPLTWLTFGMLFHWNGNSLVGYLFATIIPVIICKVSLSLSPGRLEGTIIPPIMVGSILLLLFSYLLERKLRHPKLVLILKRLFAALIIIGLLFIKPIELWMMLLIVVVFVFFPYCYTKEKNVWWMALLVYGVLGLSFYGFGASAIDGGNKYFQIVGFALLVLALVFAVLALVWYKKKRNANEAWNYCVSMTMYKEHPAFVDTLSVMLIIVVVVVSFVTGLALNDKYTLVAVPCFGLLSFAAIFYRSLYKSVNDKKEWLKAHKTFVIENAAVSLLVLLGIAATQYLHGRLLWQMLFWVLSVLLVFRMYKHDSAKEFRLSNSIIRRHYLLIWMVSFVIIPIMCMGYNVFTMPQYPRIYNGRVGNRPVFKFFEIRDKNGLIGLRDRNHLVIPMEYKSIKLCNRNSYCFVNLLPFPYSFETIDIRDRKNPWNLISFVVTTPDNNDSLWKCSDHLDMNNICTKYCIACFNYCNEDCIPGYFVYSSRYSEEYENKYIDYLKSKGSEKVMRKMIEKRFASILGYNSLKSIKRHNDEIDAIKFNRSLNEVSSLFPYLNSSTLPKRLIDDMYKKCRNYDSIVCYSDLAKYWIYAKEYERALEEAQKAVSQNEQFAECRLIETLYLNGRFEEAFALLSEKKDAAFNTSDDGDCFYEYGYYDNEVYYYEYGYFGDKVWQDMIDYKNLGLIIDTLSPSYKRLEDVLRLEVDHPDYDRVVRFKQFMPSGWIGDGFELCVKENDYAKEGYKYLMYKHERVSPVMSAFAKSLDEPIVLYVDATTGKRRYLDLSNDSIRTIKGEFDYAWRFSEGVAAVCLDNKIGFIDKNGDFVIPLKYPMHDYFSGYYGLSRDSKVLGRDNQRFVDCIFFNGLCPMSGESGDFGLIDKQGNWVVYPDFYYIGKPYGDGRRVLRKQSDTGEGKSFDFVKIDKYGHLISEY